MRNQTIARLHGWPNINFIGVRLVGYDQCLHGLYLDVLTEKYVRVTPNEAKEIVKQLCVDQNLTRSE